MANDTARLEMPLLQPAQAQKHVTVNEALMRLDGMVNLVLESVSARSASVAEGKCWGVPAGAGGAWAGQAGMIAVGSNGGWTFVPPARGMRAFVADRGAQAVFDGSGWIVGALSLGWTGSGMLTGMAEGEFSVGTGVSLTTNVKIPANVMVIGATARVIQPLKGNLTSWRLGFRSSTDRFGKGIGKAAGASSNGLPSYPTRYLTSEALVMTAEGGSFAGGRVRLAAHWLALHVPDMTA